MVPLFKVKSAKNINMNCVYVNKIGNFVTSNSDEILKLFKNNFKDYGENPEIEQQNAWESSIRYLRGVLDDNRLSSFTVALSTDYHLVMKELIS